MLTAQRAYVSTGGGSQRLPCQAIEWTLPMFWNDKICFIALS